MNNEMFLMGMYPRHDPDPGWNPRPAPQIAARTQDVMREPTAVHVRAETAVEFCVVVPTYNERGNLDELVARIDRALIGVRWEMIVVDDNSPDGTADYARSLYARNPRVRVIRRIGRRGLASACVEGMLSSSAPYLAVMDGDLQHDPATLTKMLDSLRDNHTDLVIASRYVPGGSIGSWAPARATASHIATRLARAMTPVGLSDPMSGFFAIRREVIDDCAPNLSAIGFKILLDIAITAGSGLRIREVPLRFARRELGVSKLSPGVAWDFAMMIADKTIGHVVPVRLVAFSTVGAIAMALDVAAVGILRQVTGIGIIGAQAIATLTTLIAIYTVDNLLAFKPRPRRGLKWICGLAGFAATCGIGVAASIGTAAIVFDHGLAWPLAAAAGSLAMLVWNYGAASHYSWRAV